MSGYRPIQPSLPAVGEVQGQGQGQPNQQPIFIPQQPQMPNPTGGSQQQQLHSQQQQLQQSSAFSPDPSATYSRQRRRKAPSHVSLNACTNCKKARAKCDGEEPESCSRCKQRGIVDSCHYEVHIKTAKEELVKRIKNLETRNAEKDRWISDVLSLLKNDSAIGILEQLKSNPSAAALLDAVHNFSSEQRKTLNIVNLSSRPVSERTMSTTSDDDISPRWISVIEDEATAHHLMGLYFSWVHPVHMLFSERHFMRSFRLGDSVYCSEAMLHAMCAIGCMYSVDLETGESDYKDMLETFYSHAKAEVENEDRSKATTSIAYAMLALLEGSRGQGRSGQSHLRLAVESLRLIDRNAWEEDALEICLWGLHTLNTIWSSFTYQKPPDPMPPRAKIFNYVELDDEISYWMRYRRPGDQSMTQIPSAPLQTAKAFAKLNQIVLETMNVYCGRRGRITARGLLDLYRKYLVWAAELPPRLARPVPDEDNEIEDTVPHVLFLHIWYTVVLIQLFAPLLEEPNFSSLAREHIRRLVLQNAREGLQLYDIYRRQFGSRFMTPLQAFSLVHLGDTVLKLGTRQDSIQVIVFVLETLDEARPGFPLVMPLAAMFCESVIMRSHPLPAGYDAFLGGRSWGSFTREEKLNCCDRLTYAQPIQMLVERLDPEIAESFEEEWKLLIETHGGTGPPGENAQQDRLMSQPRSNSPDKAMDMSRFMNP